MAKYQVYLWEKLCHSIEVEAESEEEAIEMAGDLADQDTGISQGWFSREVIEVED